MAERSQSRSPLLRSSSEIARHPLASSSHPTLPRRVSGTTPTSTAASGSASAKGHTSQSLSSHSKPLHSVSHVHHRPHAATISTTRPSRSALQAGSQVDLLGVGASSGVGTSQRSRRSGCDSRPSSIFSESALQENYEPIVIAEGSTMRGRPPSYRHDSNGSRSHLTHLDSLSKAELAIVETRFDLMSNHELSTYIDSLPTFDSSPGHTPQIEVTTPRLPSQAPLPSPEPPPSATASSSRPTTPPNDKNDKSPLFPPSPPRFVAAQHTVDHPLRVLSRTIRELREVIERLEVENVRLREASKPKRSSGGGKAADQISIHDGLTEAISTSLTSDSPIRELSSNPLSQSANASRSIRTLSPTPSVTRSIRPRSPASSISVPFPSSPIDSSFPSTSASQSRALDSEQSNVTPTSLPSKRSNNRSSWTSGLWVWSAGRKQQPPPRKGSIGSIASVMPTGPVTPVVSHNSLIPNISTDEDEDEWRKGDGGSSPAFRAIFLATRIITPDPSSILTSTDIPANSLIAYLAHSLISFARDEGIVAKDPLDRRRSRELSRSRAASIASQDITSSDLGTPSKETKGYGDQALAATASLGRTLLSSVSTATIRGTKVISGLSEETRPSLLSRVSSSRGFPTTAITPAQLPGQPESSATSPTEETPPPSVELASIVPDESRPPTVLLSRQNLGSFFQATKINKPKLSTASRFDGDEPPLTDRYGFIYDIQHAKMLKDASAARTPAPMSLTGAMPINGEPEGWIIKQRRGSQSSARSDLKSPKTTDNTEVSFIPPRTSTDSTASGDLAKSAPTSRKRTPGIVTPTESRTSSHTDQVRHRSSTILSLNPSPAKPVTAKDKLTVSARGASSLQPDASSSSAPLTRSLPSTVTGIETPSPNVSRLTISSLLDQLTEIHDQQQKERLVEWDSFLRKRAKSRVLSSSSSERKSEDMRGDAGLIGISQIGLSGKTGQEDWKVFTKLVRRGVPLSYRSDVWAECSGAKDSLVPGEYAEILAVHADETSPVQADIEKDVSRTFPGNVFFGGDGPGVAKLRRVLVAYSWHNPAVGYCQGMNMLAATLLLTHTDEEQAYWVLSAMIERLLPQNFYSPSLLASRADQQVLSDLVAQLVPKVHNHLETLGVDLASVTFGWFLSLFTDCLPVETLFRVWDVFFVEGHDTLFRVAVAILKLNETEIAACESVSDLFAFISSMTSRLWAADKLISLQHSYKSIIRHIDIVARCEKAVAALEKDLEGDA